MVRACNHEHPVRPRPATRLSRWRDESEYRYTGFNAENCRTLDRIDQVRRASRGRSRRARLHRCLAQDLPQAGCAACVEVASEPSKNIGIPFTSVNSNPCGLSAMAARSRSTLRMQTSTSLVVRTQSAFACVTHAMTAQSPRAQSFSAALQSCDTNPVTNSFVRSNSLLRIASSPRNVI